MRHLTTSRRPSPGGYGGPEVNENTGEATYGYALDLPAARGRFQPRLALSYQSSRHENEGYGTGWSLTTTYVEVDVSAAPSGSALSNRRQLVWLVDGGARSLLLPDGSGGYRPELAGRFVSVTPQVTNGVTTWTAIDLTGTTYTFATSLASAGPGSRHYLSQVVDADGNTCAFAYVSGGGAAALLTEISYNAFGATSPPTYATRVTLAYGAAGVPTYALVAGGVVSRSLALKSAKVEVRGPAGFETLRTYTPSYIVSNAGSALLLQRIAVSGTSASSFLPPTSFEYDFSTAGFSLADGVPVSIPAGEWLDVDADGRPDRVGGYPDLTWARNITHPLDEVLSFAPAIAVPGGSGYYVGLQGQVETRQESASCNGALSQVVTEKLVDMNGDGLPDRVRGSAAGTAYALLVKFGFLNSSGAFAFESSETVFEASKVTDTYNANTNQISSQFAFEHSCNGWTYMFLADVNRDGIQDFVITLPETNLWGLVAPARWAVFPGYRTSAGQWGFGDATTYNTPTSNRLEPRMPSDRNADGLIDLRGDAGFYFGEIFDFSPQLAWNSYGIDGVTPGTAGMDGWSPFDAPLPSGIVTCPEPAPDEALCNPPYNLFDPREHSGYADLNGDGRPDLLGHTGPGTAACAAEPCPMAVTWNTGAGFGGGNLVLNPLLPDGTRAEIWPRVTKITDDDVQCTCIVDDPNVPVTSRLRWGTRTFLGWWAEPMDLNGDGIADYATSQYSDRFGWVFFRGSVGRSHLLRAVTTSTGARYAIDYAPSSTFGASPSHGPPDAVVRVSLTGPRMPAVATSFWYAEPKSGTLWYEPHRREGRGFARSWAQDDATRIVRATKWQTGSHAFVGAPTLVEWGTPSGATLTSGAPASTVFRQARYEQSARTRGSSTCASGTIEPGWWDYPVVPVTTVAEHTDFVGTASLTSLRRRACTDVDDFGNVLREEVVPDNDRPERTYWVHATFATTSSCKTCPVTTTTKTPSGTGLTYASYFYDAPAGTWAGATAAVSSAGRLNYVRRLVPGSPGDYEIESATAYNADGTVAFRVVDPDVGSHALPVTESYTYDDQRLRVVQINVKDNSGRELVRKHAYDSLGRLRREVGPYVSGAAEQPAQEYAYDTFGRVLAVGRSVSGTTVTGAMAAYEYGDPVLPDAGASVRSHTFLAPLTFTAGSVPIRPDVKLVVAHLDGLGRTVQVRERLGAPGTPDPAANISVVLSGFRVTSAVRLDGAGRAIGALEPFFSATDTYEPFANLAQTFGRRGSTVAFDTQGRVTCTSSGVYAAATAALAACTSSFVEDPQYRVSSRFAYDAEASSSGANVLVSAFAPSTGTVSGTTAAYSAAGLLEWTSDPHGNTVTHGYDRLGRLLTVRRHAFGTSASIDQVLTRSYDTLGRVLTEHDGNWSPGASPSRSYRYDAAGRVVQVDLAPLPIAGTTARPSLKFEYKSLGRRTRMDVVEPVSVSGNLSFTTRNLATYAYDLAYLDQPAAYPYTAGRLSHAASPVSTIAVGYDQNGRAARRDQWLTGFGSGAFTSTGTFSDDGRLLNAGFTSSYGSASWTGRYDSSGRPVEISWGMTKLWEAASKSASTGAYDALGRLAEVKSNDSLVSTFRNYGAYSGQLTSQVVRTAAEQVHSAEQLLFFGAKLETFRDPLTNTTYSYRYDAAGRLDRAQATATDPAVAATSLSQRFDQGYSFTDPDWPAFATQGNLEVVTTHLQTGGAAVSDYGYAEDRLVSMSSPSLTLTHDHAGRVARKDGAASEEFGYDVQDRLRWVTRAGALAEELEYDAVGELMFRKAGTKATYYVGPFATVTADVTSGCTYSTCAPTNVTQQIHVLIGGTRIASLSGTSALYYHRDWQGSVVATTLNGGLVGARYRYGPYGENDRAQLVRTGGESELGYTGGLKLSGALLHLQARVYDASLRRFLQADTVELTRYTYVGGDPVNFVDPSGRMGNANSGPTSRSIVSASSDTLSDKEEPLPDGCSKNPKTGDVTCKLDEQKVSLSERLAQVDGFIAAHEHRKAESQGGRQGLGHRPGFGTPWFYVHLFQATSPMYKVRAQSSGREYLIDYGFRYALMFSEWAEFTSSSSVRDAIGSILIQLQLELEIGIEANPLLMDDPAALGKFAFDSHVSAYESGGFGGLTLAEQVEFLHVVNVTDMGAYGVATAARVVAGGVRMVNLPLPGLVPYP